MASPNQVGYPGTEIQKQVSPRHAKSLNARPPRLDTSLSGHLENAFVSQFNRMLGQCISQPARQQADQKSQNEHQSNQDCPDDRGNHQNEGNPSV